MVRVILPGQVSAKNKRLFCKMFKRKQKPQNDAEKIQAQLDYDRINQSYQWSVKQWVQNFINTVDGLPLDKDNRRHSNWFEVSKSHFMAILLELDDVEIKTLKSLLVIRTSDVDRLMTDALLNRCRSCDFLLLKIEQEQNGAKVPQKPPIEKTADFYTDAHKQTTVNQMATWHYYNEQGDKVTVTGKELKALAKAGLITPETIVETEEGTQAPARKVKGLNFTDTLSIEEDDIPPVTEETYGIAPPPSFTVPSVEAAPSVSIKNPPALFCTNCGNTVPAHAVACMSCGARPTGHRKFCRHCGVAVNPEQVMCIQCGASLKSNSGIWEILSHFYPADPIKGFNIYFMIFWICTVIWLLEIIIPETVISFLLIMAGIIGSVSGCVLLYQAWKLIPADIARTTPEKAVGFSFIPFYNFYWLFIAYKGLGEDMNKTLRQRGIQYQVDEGWGQTYCVLFSFYWVSFIASLAFFWAAGILFLAIIANYIALIFFLRSIKIGAVAILELNTVALLPVNQTIPVSTAGGSKTPDLPVGLLIGLIIGGIILSNVSTQLLSIGQVCGNESTPLALAKFLVSAGANVNAKNSVGQTPLLWCSDRVDTAKFLVSRGADVNAKDEWGHTLLHNAARHGYINMVKFLVSAGADVDARDENGYTPLDVAKNKYEEEKEHTQYEHVVRLRTALSQVIRYLESVGAY